jgi:hypothetical protein
VRQQLSARDQAGRPVISTHDQDRFQIGIACGLFRLTLLQLCTMHKTAHRIGVLGDLDTTASSSSAGGRFTPSVDTGGADPAALAQSRAATPPGAVAHHAPTRRGVRPVYGT